MALCCLLGAGQKSSASPFPCPGEVISHPPVSGNPPRGVQSPLLCARHPSDPYLHPVCVPSAYLAAQCTCLLSRAAWLSFKTPNFRDRAWLDPYWSSEGWVSLPMFAPEYRCLEHGVKPSQGSVSRLAPQQVSSCLCRGGRGGKGTHQLCCPW